MKIFFIKLIKLYQNTLSPEQSIWVKIGIKKYKNTCCFYPTCSNYSIQAIEKYGILKGFKISFFRILKCRPGTKPQINKLS